MSRYTLSDFHKILEAGIDNKIPDETMKILNMLENKVGAPEYIKTPQFKSKTSYTSNNISVRRKKKTQEMNDKEWETIRNFQETELKKTEGIEKNIHIIRKYLNMLTENTYNKLTNTIIMEINSIVSIDNDNDLIYLCSY